MSSRSDGDDDYSSSSDDDKHIDFLNGSNQYYQRSAALTSSDDYSSGDPGCGWEEYREIHMNSQEEDSKEIKHSFQEILTQLKAYGESRRIKRVKRSAARVSNGRIEPQIRSISASIGNHLDEGSDRLHSPYLSLVKDKVLYHKDKYTGMSLMHYACEYGCLRFLKAICKARGPHTLIRMICEQSHSGKNGLHFMARNHCTAELNYFFKVTRQLKKACQQSNSHDCSQNSGNSASNQYRESNGRHDEERKESRTASSSQDTISDVRQLQSLVLQALKAQDFTHERNSVLHVALTCEFRFPEELSIDFEENFELSESHYGEKSRSRRQFRKFEIEYLSVKNRLKESFIAKLIELLNHQELTLSAFKQVNAS